jgi:hypothetical protein
VGIVDPEELGRHAGELDRRGIHSSTVGIGDAYSPEQLQVIAEAGGGRMHDAEWDAEIEEVVVAELGEILQTDIEDVELEVDVPQGARIESLSPYPCEGVHTLRLRLGSILPGACREALLQVSTPRGGEDDSFRFSLRASARFREDGDRILSPVRTVGLGFAAGPDNDAQSRDLAVSRRVVDLWLARLVRTLGHLNRFGDPRAARTLHEREGKWFERFATGIPGAEESVTRYRYLVERARRPIRERLRKEMILGSYKGFRGEADYRSHERADFLARIVAEDDSD